MTGLHPTGARRLARAVRGAGRRVLGVDRRGKAQAEALFTLFLGRPAQAQDIAGNLATPIRRLASALVASDEFEFRVLAPIRGRRILEGEVFKDPPQPELLDWAARNLAPNAADRVRKAQSWYELYGALFGDPDIQALAPRLNLGGKELHDTLAALHRTHRLHHIVGMIEEHDGDHIRGWVADLKALDRPLRVELWLDGAFAAAAQADRFRREIQDLYGGSGVAGFSIPSLPRGDRTRQAEVREATTGASLGAFVLAPRAAPVSELAELRRELAEARAALERVEQALPRIGPAFSFPVSAYDAYVEAYEGAAEFVPVPLDPAAPSITIVVDALGIGADRVEAFLGSLAVQQGAAWDAVVICPRGEAAAAIRDMVASFENRSGRRLRVRAAPAACPQLAFHRVLRQALGELAVFVSARDRLAVGALHRIATASAGAEVIFGDDDVLEALSPRLSRRTDPRLRSAFDLDLLHQSAALGDLIAVRKDAALAAGGLRTAPSGAHLHDLVLRMVERSGERAVRHTPHVLLHRVAPAAGTPVEVSCEAVSAHLGRTEPQAVVEARSDILGATLQGALRVRRPHLVEGRRAAVIIPTRDRLDLLKPCIDSLLERLPYNRVSQDIVVVDNRSVEPETLDYLAKLQSGGQVRVMRYDAPFNWALMNNAAARDTDADVLIFLNNDTVALSQDWCDALCEQAMRPQVAAAGARLLYDDGTIQHGGVIVGILGFSAHEAVGQDGSAPGYMGRQALVRRVSAITGACMATRRDVFEQLGGFDGLSFPVDGNDIDYCLRAADLGYGVVYTPDATLYHLESKSRGYNYDAEKRARGEMADRAMWARWGSTDRLDPFYSPRFSRDARPFARLRPLS